MAISALNEIARINEELDVNFEGEDLKISLNSKYLLEFIQNIPKEKELVLEFMYSNSAVKVYEFPPKSLSLFSTVAPWIYLALTIPDS